MLVGEGRRRHSFVAMQDVAAYAVAMLENQAAVNETIPIGGPEPVSWRDVVEMAEHEVGRPIEIQNIGLGEPVPGLPNMSNSVLTALEMYDSPIDMREASARYGVPPTSLHTWAHSAFNSTSASADEIGVSR
jgi:NADH dehydrogenase